MLSHSRSLSVGPAIHRNRSNTAAPSTRHAGGYVAGCRVGLEPRARIGMRLAVAMRLATWHSHDHIFLYLVLRDTTRISACVPGPVASRCLCLGRAFCDLGLRVHHRVDLGLRTNRNAAMGMRVPTALMSQGCVQDQSQTGLELSPLRVLAMSGLRMVSSTTTSQDR